jgi:hypothetical protein
MALCCGACLALALGFDVAVAVAVAIAWLRGWVVWVVWGEEG